MRKNYPIRQGKSYSAVKKVTADPEENLGRLGKISKAAQAVIGIERGACLTLRDRQQTLLPVPECWWIWALRPVKNQGQRS